MTTAHFWFHADLRSFLPAERRSGEWIETFGAGQTFKHLIEAAGLPHTEIGLLRVNGRPTLLDQIAQNEDQAAVFPATAITAPLEIEPRFILDAHLGRLAAYLRLLGFDACYRNDFDDPELAQRSAAETRILLSRDRRLLMRKIVQHGYCLRSLNPRQQLHEVVSRFDLSHSITPFQRCPRCNQLLEAVPKDQIIERLQPLTQIYYNAFHICPTCGQIYWKGSHYEHMLALLNEFTPDSSASPLKG